MATNPHDDYESLAKLLYPSIEASGNVYYGQTRKLTIDTLFNKNNFGFESHIESERLADSTSDYGFTYSAKYCWKLGPFHGMFDYAPDKDYDVYYAKYKIVLEDNAHLLSLPPLSSGNFPIYERDAKVEYVDLYFNYGRVPGSDTEYWDGRNFYVVKDGNDYFLYIAVKQNHMLDHLPDEYSNDGEVLVFRAEPSNDVALTFRLVWNGSGAAPQNAYQIKWQGGNGWEYYTLDSDIYLQPGEHIAFRSTDSRPAFSSSNYVRFIFTDSNQRVSAYGSMHALGYRGTQSNSYEYAHLFDGCSTLAKAPNIPGNKVNGRFAYIYTFRDCTNLIEPPVLPATELKDSCYRYMFQGCTSLKTAPKLPATDLANICYDHMFYGCTSLEVAPELPATNLTVGCYGDMFNGCTSLKIAPELPATTTSTYCYDHMFYGCTSLNNVSVGLIGDFTTDTSALTNWLSLVARTGTFYCVDGSQYKSNSFSGIPSGWVRKTYPRPKEQPESSDYIRDTMITSGSDSDTNGRGSVTDKSTVFNMLNSNPFLDGSVQPNTYNEDGSYNQDVWGYKCFNSPVSFRNGIYGEFGNLTSYTPNNEWWSPYTDVGGTKLSCKDDTRESVLHQYYGIYNYNDQEISEVDFELDAVHGAAFHSGIAALTTPDIGRVYIAGYADSSIKAPRDNYIIVDSSPSSITVKAADIYLNGTVHANNIEGVIDNARNLAYNAEPGGVKLEAISTGVTAYSSIIPNSVNNQYTFGSSSNKWYKVYAVNADVSGRVDIGGALEVQDAAAFHSKMSFMTQPDADADEILYSIAVEQTESAGVNTDSTLLITDSDDDSDSEGPSIKLHKTIDSNDEYLSSSAIIKASTDGNNFAYVRVASGNASSTVTPSVEIKSSADDTTFATLTFEHDAFTVDFNDRESYVQFNYSDVKVDAMDIVPTNTSTQNLGSIGHKWDTLYATNLGSAVNGGAIATANISTLSAAAVTVSGAASVGGDLSVGGESIVLQNLYGTYCGSYSNNSDWLYITVNANDWASTVYPQINFHRENKSDASLYNTDVTIRCSPYIYTNRAEIKTSYDNSTNNKYKVSLLAHDGTDETKLDLTPSKVEISATSSSTSSITVSPGEILCNHLCIEDSLSINCNIHTDRDAYRDIGEEDIKFLHVYAHRFCGCIPTPLYISPNESEKEPDVGTIFLASILALQNDTAELKAGDVISAYAAPMIGVRQVNFIGSAMISATGTIVSNTANINYNTGNYTALCYAEFSTHTNPRAYALLMRTK